MPYLYLLRDELNFPKNGPLKPSSTPNEPLNPRHSGDLQISDQYARLERETDK